ncbi:MAG: hypothetical protein C0391_06320 [Anaerolinea sp.]|nr:hypothetical protein [Anaerolinea sp.]
MAAQNYQLVIKTGPDTGKVFSLLIDKVSIGRDPASDIFINDIEVSRHHAVITKKDEGYNIEDQGSTNGTIVDGKRLTQLYPLIPGDEIKLGKNVTLVFELVPLPDPNELDFSPFAEFIPPPPPSPPPPFISEHVEPFKVTQTVADPARPTHEVAVPAKLKQKNSPNLTWLIVLVLMLVLSICGLALWFVDHNYLWCSLLQFLPACQ